MHIKFILYLLPVVALMGCGRGQAPVSPVPPLEPDRGQVWQLVGLQGRPLDRAGKAPTLRFNPAAGTATGTAYCNEYTFHYTARLADQQPDGDRYDLQLSFWGGGSLDCPEADMNAERRYLALLGRASSMRITSSTLTLYQKDKETLQFELQ